MTETVSSLKEQLLHIQQLHTSGVLDDAAYQQGKATLERKLLDLVMAGAPVAGVAITNTANTANNSGQPGQPGPGDVAAAKPGFDTAAPGLDKVRPRPSTLLASAAFVVLVAVAGYLWTGSPSLVTETAAVAAAQPASAPHALGADQINAMAEKLKERLKDKPDDAEGWAMLGRSYAVLGRAQEAVPAYARAVELVGENAGLLADYADVLALANNRSLEGEPMKMIQRALKANPDQLKALSLAGTYAFEKKDYATAVKYWERIVVLAPNSPDAPKDPRFVDQVRASVAEARQLAGMPPAPDAPPAAPMAQAAQAAQGGDAPAAAAPNPDAFVSGKVTLAAALAAKASPDDTVFIFARAAEGPRMPLAIIRKQVKDLPIEFKLDDAMAMQPAMRLSAFPRVVVGARVSKKGDAVPQPGDLQGASEPIKVGTANLEIEISQVVGAK
jgi:cytochrome c-type biogenesis protein CcmH